MDFNTMLQLPVLEISQVIKILQEIADQERTKEKPNMPKVIISTTTGNVSGYFINYDTSKNIILLGNWYDNNPELQYVQSHAISSISLVKFNKYIHLLSDGKIPFTPDTSDIPTLLQLKKEIKELELDLNKTFDKEISIVYKYEGTPEDLDKFYASKVLLLLKETLSKIAGDKLAKESFREVTSVVNFSLENTNECTLKDDVLSVVIDVSKGLKSALTANQLQTEIEKTL
ncbi:hypothetical protein [Joostella sp.]|uniref:hypothetical protein n=1 Tax=Joostella sp. TaxID=2231138 RepID=UPI003A929D26